MSVIFDSLTARLIPKLRALLAARPESYASDVWVANKVIPGKARMVTLTTGPGTGTLDTLDDSTVRVNIYSTDEADAEDLAYLVRALFEAVQPVGMVDGDPLTGASTNAGPVEVPNDTVLFQWYLVVNITRRGTQFS